MKARDDQSRLSEAREVGKERTYLRNRKLERNSETNEEPRPVAVDHVLSNERSQSVHVDENVDTDRETDVERRE